jgi:DNA polymerase-1
MTKREAVLADPNCTDCPLYKTVRSVCVPADGDTGSEIMFLGRNPGVDEDKGNRPFIGRAGQLLRDAIDRSDLNESEIFITNVVKCHTPENRKPTAAELEACDKYLQAELKKVKPRYIFAFGNEALGRLTGKKHGEKGKNGAPGITSLQGKVMEVGDYMVFPMAHPSYIVRQGGVEDNKGGERARAAYLAAFAANVSRVRNMQTDAYNEDSCEPDVKLCLNAKAVHKALDDLETHDVIAFDLETQGLVPYDDKSLHIVCLSGDGQTAYVVPFEHPETDQSIVDDLPRIKERLGTLLTEKKTVAQHGQFDLRWLRAKGVRCRCSFDTQYACHILDENVPSKLKARNPEDVPGQVEMYLGVASGYSLDMSNADTHIWPLRELSKYGGKDSAYTWRLRRYHLKRFAKEPRLLKLFANVTMPAVELLTQIEMNGIAVDWDYLDSLFNKEGKGKLDKRLKKITRTFQKSMPRCPTVWDDGVQEKPMKGDWDTDDLGILLHDGLEFPVIEFRRTAKTNLASLSDKSLMDVKADVIADDEAVAFVDMVMDYADIRKDQAFVEGWREAAGRDGRIHATYWMNGTVTGRTSCREPNIQQVPRRLRLAFVARKGWTLLQVDYSQLELRLAAWDAQDEVMLDIFACTEAKPRGGDIHTATAAEVAGVPESEVDKQLRNKGKPINFGFLYGMSSDGFQEYARYSYGEYFTKQESADAREAFFTKYPRLKPWHKRRKDECKRTGEVISVVGRKRRPTKIHSPNRREQGYALRQAVNSPIQGGGSDITVFAGTLLLPELDLREIMPTAFVHDSFLMEVRNDRLEYWEQRIEEHFEGVREPLREYLDADIGVPLLADVETGDSWAFGAKGQR